MGNFRWQRWLVAGLVASCVFFACLCSGAIWVRNSAREGRRQYIRNAIRSGRIGPEDFDAALEGEPFSPSEIESLKIEVERQHKQSAGT